MDSPTIIVIAFFGGAITQLLFCRLYISILVPTTALSLWILFTEFFQPYKGGGASMWIIALFFVITYSTIGAGGGAQLIAVITKTGKPK